MTVIDLNAARLARDAAVGEVETTHAEWCAEALKVVQWVATRNRTFTTDHFWAAAEAVGLERPREPRAMGAVMGSARRAGMCEATPSFVSSKRVTRHAGPIRVWRSLVFAEPVARPVPPDARQGELF